MNNFEKHGFDESNFSAKGNVVSAFDVFPKSKPEYITRTEGGGKWTVLIGIISLFLLWSETGRWWRGEEEHTFAVEKGVSRIMQINIDVVVHMKCQDIHINVQDSSGDRILAAKRLQEDPTNWQTWADARGVHKLNHDKHGRIDTGAGWLNAEATEEGFGEEHVHDIVALGKKRAKWARTPRPRGEPDSCRIFGSLELNKVQGDFHITARGHGYMEMGGGNHLDHSQFNFSHIVSELSFGKFYPSLINPLDQTVNTAPDNFHKFQYYLSVVPTLYSVGRSTILTNQYAVTEQSKEINAHAGIPGIFVKYDIEPILLRVEERRDGFIVFLLKLINVISGVLVAGHWGYTISEWVNEVRGKRSRSDTNSQGMLGVKAAYLA